MKYALFFLLAATTISSCKNTWSQEDKEAFYQACTEEAVKAGDTKEQAKNYCDCVFGKMAKKYPDENDALDHMTDLARDTDLIRCKMETR